MEEQHIYLQCPAELLERFGALASKAFISTFYSPCANVIETDKISSSILYHVDPQCLCCADDPRVVYLDKNGEKIDVHGFVGIQALAGRISGAEYLTRLRLQDQAMLHSKSTRAELEAILTAAELERVEEFHYRQAKQRTFAMCQKLAFSTIYLITQPCSAAFSAASRIKKLLRKIGFQTHVCYFGQSVTEEKMFNVRQDASVFVTVNTCACRNAPWLVKHQHRNVLSMYELLCQLGAAEKSLEYETQIEIMISTLEKYVESESG